MSKEIKLNTLAWTTIILIGLFDLSFALYYYDSFTEWEMNSFAIDIAQSYGKLGLVVMKLLSLSFALGVMLLAYSKERLAAARTLTISFLVVHLLLVGWYLQ